MLNWDDNALLWLLKKMCFLILFCYSEALTIWTNNMK